MEKTAATCGLVWFELAPSTLSRCLSLAWATNDDDATAAAECGLAGRQHIETHFSMCNSKAHERTLVDSDARSRFDPNRWATRALCATRLLRGKSWCNLRIIESARVEANRARHRVSCPSLRSVFYCERGGCRSQ